jgi:hypothetical protein
MILGTTQTSVGKRPFLFDLDPGQFRHALLIGKSGTGKSTLLLTIVAEAIKNGLGVAVIDPHGDLIYDSFNYIPWSRLKDLVFLDPENDRAPGLGILDYPNKKQALRIVMTITEAHAGTDGWGKQTATIFRNVFRCVLERFAHPDALLVFRLLADDDFAKEQFSRCKDFRTRVFYKQYFLNMTKKDRIEKFSHPLNKWEELVEDDLVEFFGQSKSINFRKLMDDQKIVFCRIPKSYLEERSARILGSSIIMKFKTEATRRKRRNKQFLIIADEFPNFTDGIDVDTTFAESRKNGVHFIVTTQTRTQLKKNADVIIGNVSHIFAFRMSALDAKEILENLGDNRDYYPQLVLIKNFTFKALTMDDDTPTPSDPITLLRKPKKDRTYVPARKAIAWAKANTGTPKEDLHKQFQKALRN